MRRYCCLRALIILWLLSMQAHSHNTPIENFIFWQSTNNAEFFQNVPALEPVNNPGVMTPAIDNTDHKHSFKIVSRPGSPATKITLLFDDPVRLVTSEKGISVGVNRLKDSKYRINIELPASKKQREHHFSLVGTGRLNSQKIKVNDRPYQSKVYQYNSKKETSSTKNIESDWEHIINYRREAKSNLYSEQLAWLQQPAPLEIVAMVVIKRENSDADTSESNASDTATNQEENPPQPSAAGGAQASSQPNHSGGAGGSPDIVIRVRVGMPPGTELTPEMRSAIAVWSLFHRCPDRCNHCGGNSREHTAFFTASKPKPDDK